MKRCTQCGEVKSREQFSPNKTGKDGLHTWCKFCKAASARHWHSTHREQRRVYDREDYEANGEKARQKANDWHRANRPRSLANKRDWKLRLYGLTPEDYQRAKEQQGGLCAVCRGPQTPGRDLAVDHDHATNDVRGLLCHHCNVGIGHFFDAPELLRAAADYLERAKQRKTA
jgi:hypothetical protein